MHLVRARLRGSHMVSAKFTSNSQKRLKMAKKMHAASKFIGNSSACVRVQASGRTRVRSEKATPER